MLSVAGLTKQLVQMGVRSSSRPMAAVVLGTQAPTYLTEQTRSFASGSRKKLDAKNNKRLKIQAKKKKNVTKPAVVDPAEKKEEQPFLQHQEWVKFQQSISVDGFQTGQVTTAKVIKKSKGGKQVRRKKEKELALEKSQDPLRLEKFPAIRYSPEETERLLAEAFSMLPERTGKRGTLNLRRQKRRWFLVRKIHAKYKGQRALEHERKMEKRTEKRKAVVAVMEAAPETRVSDLDYQEQVLRRWAQSFVEDQGTSSFQEKLSATEE